MANSFTKFGVPLVVLIGIFWQLVARDIVIATAGVGRVVENIDDFPYTCRRIQDGILQSCEDMWLDEQSRMLFLACSTTSLRKEWMPAVSNFNATGRPLNDSIIAVSIDEPIGSSYAYKILSRPPTLSNYHALAIKGSSLPSGSSRLHVVNLQPSFSPSGIVLDPSTHGANATIEVLTYDPKSFSLVHEKTYHDPLISTPNNLALNPDGSIYVVNDRGAHKTGLMAQIPPPFAYGNIAYCPVSGACRTVASGLRFPNGPVRKGNKLLVPGTAVGRIYVFTILPNGDLQPEETISHDVPTDNLSMDSEGDVFAPGFPKALEMLEAVKADDPWTAKTPKGIVWRFREGKSGWEGVKVLEDAEGRVLPAPTAVVHDASTGRLFLSGLVSPFITVCEPR